MNWLMYIGGGLTIFYIWGCFVARMEESGGILSIGKNASNSEMFGLIMTLLAPIAVWIWICLKFIK